MNSLNKSQKILLSILGFILLGLFGLFTYSLIKSEQNSNSNTVNTPPNKFNTNSDEELYSFPNTEETITLQFPSEEKVIDQDFGQIYYQNHPEQDVFYEDILNQDIVRLFSLSDTRDMDRAIQSSTFAYSLNTTGEINVIFENSKLTLPNDEFLQKSNPPSSLQLSPEGSNIVFRASQRDANFTKVGVGSFEKRTIFYLEDTARFIAWQDDSSFFYQRDTNGRSKELLFATILSNGSITTENIDLGQGFQYPDNEWQFDQVVYSQNKKYLYTQLGLGSSGPTYEEYSQFIIDMNSDEIISIKIPDNTFKVDDIVFDPAEKNILYAYSTNDQSFVEIQGLVSEKIVMAYIFSQKMSEMTLDFNSDNKILVQDKETFIPQRKTFKFTIDLDNGVIDQFISFVERGIHIY